MSAIFGIINKNGKPVEDTMIDKIQSSLLHRAVDGKSIFKEGNMMFGHHKLIVHRRQAQEQQPFEIEDCVITCDARIDNIEELFTELNLSRTSKNFTDPFIILQAYKKWGNECVNHLKGEFCFAIWNKITRTFFGATDHIGFRTFYYYENKEIFVFASQIKAITIVKKEPLEINKDLFVQYFVDFYPSVTYDKKIHFLKSGHKIVSNEKSEIEIMPYWSAKSNKKFNFKTDNDCYAFLLKTITNKIKYQLDSDYPIGILLSGGLDSSFVASIACKLLKEQNRKLFAFCSVLPDNYKGIEKDEKFYIEKLKQHFDNLEVHYISTPRGVDSYSGLEKAFDYVEEPVNTLHYVEAALFKKAQELNIRTLLSGLGGDETISSKGHDVIWNYFNERSFLKGFKLLLKKYQVENDTLMRQIKREIFTNIRIYNQISSFLHGNNSITEIPLKKSIIKKINIENSPEKKSDFILWINAGGFGLMMESWIKHGHGYNLEFLSPLLSKEVVDIILDIPEYHFLKNGINRSLIKNLMKNLVPVEIITRNDKMPFAPNYGEKVCVIELENLKKYMKNKLVIEEMIGIDFEMLSNLIRNIDSLKENKDGQLFYIPAAIIAIEFYLKITDNNS